MKIDKSNLLKNKSKLIIIGIVIFVIILLAVVFLVKNNSSEKPQDPTKTISSDDSDSDDANNETETKNNTEDSDDESDENEDTYEDVTENATYEEWLAASVTMAISMHYFEFDFEIKELYLASETELNSHDDSEGVYAVFTADGKEKVIYAKPIDEERDTAGTKDMSEQHIGYATFDEADVKGSVLKKCKKVSIEDLSDIINRLMLVTIYEH